MACGLTAGRRGEQKPGISKYPQLRWVRSDGWIFRAVIRQSRRLRICGGSDVVTKFSRRRRKVVTPTSHQPHSNSLTPKPKITLQLQNRRSQQSKKYFCHKNPHFTRFSSPRRPNPVLSALFCNQKEAVQPDWGVTVSGKIT